jgi:3-deoxy-D-manno-octulosonic acid (KDO) 8-phosphate synthase
MSLRDVGLLRGLVATGNQHNDASSFASKVYPITRPDVNSQLKDSVAHRIMVAQIPAFDSRQSPLAGARDRIQAVEPIDKCRLKFRRRRIRTSSGTISTASVSYSCRKVPD